MALSSGRLVTSIISSPGGKGVAQDLYFPKSQSLRWIEYDNTQHLNELRSFIFRGTNIWNNLDDDLKQRTSLTSFKRALRDSLLRQTFPKF